ncbi:hypothetical protein [Thalassoroseus pseudoceratinae]|uniref:hypothetical protein n=1 Tax=Thalassoroseus pseudoceratinae TaxID=2713176 RepID=UPI0014227C92|nr:hypothetical protein [Thalassoroseus pseudoceratinae]
MACPFCAPTDPTLSERVSQSDAASLGQWVEAQEMDGSKGAETKFAVLSHLKFPEKVKPATIHVPEFVRGQTGDLFLLLGQLDPDSESIILWERPEAITETAFQYVNQAPAPETAPAKRLPYFHRFLEFSDPLIGDDAYAEFAKAPYEAVFAARESYSREKLRKWLTSEDVLAPRRGLYGLLLGLVGNDEDAQLLKQLIDDQSDSVRLGIDGVMAGFVLLRGNDGLRYLRLKIFEDPKTPITDVHAGLTAMRFLWRSGPPDISRDIIKETVHGALDRPEAADLAIADLARWKDWSVQEELMTLYHKKDTENPLGQIATRRAIIRYLLASSLDDDAKDQPQHVEQAKQYIEEIRKSDPRGVAAAERIFGRRRLRSD